LDLRAATTPTSQAVMSAAPTGHRQSRGAAAADARLRVKARLAARDARDPSFASRETCRAVGGRAVRPIGSEPWFTAEGEAGASSIPASAS
jgi:hypothetical protein